MYPILREGDNVQIKINASVSIGDVIIFVYKNNILTAHRLLKIENERYFCKGDNTLRLEDINKDQIIGKVLLDNDKNNNPEFIQSSLNIAKLFRKCGYNAEKTKELPEYNEYKCRYLEL